MDDENVKNVIEYEDEDTEEYDEVEDRTPQQSTEEVLEKAGILSNGEVKELPPPLTSSQKQKEYKRKMTEKRLEALKKAREAKKLKRERMMKEKEQPIKRDVNKKHDVEQPRTQPKRQKQKETDDERIERLVMEKLEKFKPKQSQPNVKKETDEERIERLVQERLKQYKPKEPELTPKEKADLEEQARLRKMLYGY